MQFMSGLDELREHGRMTWVEEEHGWAAAPEDVVDALSSDGFEECKRETTTSADEISARQAASGRASTRARDPWHPRSG